MAGNMESYTAGIILGLTCWFLGFGFSKVINMYKNITS